MRKSSLVLVVLLGGAVPLVAACSGRTLEPSDASAGAAGSAESGGSAGASAGTSPGGAIGIAGTSLGGAAGVAGASLGGAAGVAGGLPDAGAGGVTPREPVKHRASETTCDHTRPSNPSNAPADGDPTRVACHSHEDCNQGENGRCVGNGHDGWQCTYDNCFADADCASSSSAEPRLCMCEGGVRSDNNVCLPGNCRLDADCGTGGYCSPSLGSCGNYSKVVGYYCHTPDDECVDDADCGGGAASALAYCAFMPTIGHWKCSTTHCVG